MTTKLKRRSIRGVLLVLGIFVLGGAVLGGLFLAPRPHGPPIPAGAENGVPQRPLRFVSYNILHSQRGLEKVADEIKQLEPDFVFLQEVEAADAMPLAHALGMEANYYPQCYQTSVNLAGPRASWGNLILSKHPLYAAESIPNPGGGSLGVWAEAIIDGKRFVIANVHLSATWNANPIHVKKSGENRNKELSNLIAAWKSRGSPAIVIGGDFNQIPMGNNYSLMTQHWTDALAVLGETGTTFGEGMLKTRIDYFLLSPGWKPTGCVIAASNSSDHRPIEVTVGSGGTASTAPTTRP